MHGTDNKSVGQLWDALNRPGRRPAPQATYDAVLYESREHGIAQLTNPSCERRLADLSTKQVAELIAALMRLQAKYPAAITDELILTLGECV